TKVSLLAHSGPEASGRFHPSPGEHRPDTEMARPRNAEDPRLNRSRAAKCRPFSRPRSPYNPDPVLARYGRVMLLPPQAPRSKILRDKIGRWNTPLSSQDR